MSKKPRDPQAASESVKRIALALGQPVSALYDEEAQMTREAETLALVTAFDRITDSQARAKCIAFVYAEAASEEHN